MHGFVKAVSASPGHTVWKVVLPEIELVQGFGVTGDAHAGVTVQHRSRVAKNPAQPNLRQVHLLHDELLVELQQKGFAVEPGLMGETITTSGIDLLGLPAAALLRSDSGAAVEVTGLRNPCDQLEGIQRGLMQAVLDRDEQGNLVRRAGVMGIVLTGGVIRAGDSIVVEAPNRPFVALGPV